MWSSPVSGVFGIVVENVRKRRNEEFDLIANSPELIEDFVLGAGCARRVRKAAMNHSCMPREGWADLCGVVADSYNQRRIQVLVTVERFDWIRANAEFIFFGSQLFNDI